MIQRIFNLSLILLLLTAVGASSGKVWGLSLHPVEEGSSKHDSISVPPTVKQTRAMNLPKDVCYKLYSKGIWKVSEGNKTIGWVYNSLLLAPEVEGFAGPTPFWVYINKSDVVCAILPQENNETPDFYRSALRLLRNYKGQKVSDLAEAHIDVISGATYSSQGIKENMRAVLAAHLHVSHKSSVEPAVGWGSTLLVIAALCLTFYVIFFQRGKRLWRNFILLLNVVVLGFWSGQFLSFTLLNSWATDGVNLWQALPLVLIALIAFLMPLWLRYNVYCTWICPFGSLQELLTRLPIKPIRISKNAQKIMRLLRRISLATLLVFLWFGLGSIFFNIEPFAFFSLKAAPSAAIILASIILFTSLFIPRPWCRMFCPLGMLLDIETMRWKR